MGKPERKARERTCSSSSYFLRCFGISWKIHSDKPILNAGQEKQTMKMKVKKKMRIRWFSRPPNFRLKNGEITPAPIYETEKQNVIVEDDKQNLFRVIRHVTDPKNIATSGFKSVEHESNEDMTRVINGYQLQSVAGNRRLRVKAEGIKGEKSSRFRKGSRVGSFDPIIGISIIMLTLMIMLIWGLFVLLNDSKSDT